MEISRWNSFMHYWLWGDVCWSRSLLIHRNSGDIIFRYSVCVSFVASQFHLLLLQIAFTALVYPALILAYMGQAAYLSKHHEIKTSYMIGFYASVPGTSFVIYLNCIELSWVQWLLPFDSRQRKVACSSVSYMSLHCWKPSDHQRDILDHKPELFTWLFPKSQSSSHLAENSWPNLHPWDQLDAHVPLCRSCVRIQRYEKNGQCIKCTLLFPNHEVLYVSMLHWGVWMDHWFSRIGNRTPYITVIPCLFGCNGMGQGLISPIVEESHWCQIWG